MSRRAMFPSVLTRSCALMSAVPLALAVAVSSAHAENPYVAEVTGTTSRVHVRSGPSTNFYPVLRLSAGDRVTVVGEESGWYAISPPDGCYSLISKHYVDAGAGGEGVVNGNAVRVRAGSSIDEHRYAVQRKLDKGAVVRIIGEEGDSFLKIIPPEGARLWISGDYVVRVPDDQVAAADAPREPQPQITEQVAARVVADRVDAPPVPPIQPPVVQHEVVMTPVDDRHDLARNESTIIIAPEITQDIATSEGSVINEAGGIRTDAIAKQDVITEEVEIIAPSFAPATSSEQVEDVSPIEITMIPVPNTPVPARYLATSTQREATPSFLPERSPRVNAMALAGGETPREETPNRESISEERISTDAIVSAPVAEEATDTVVAMIPTRDINESSEAVEDSDAVSQVRDPQRADDPQVKDEVVAQVDYTTGDQRARLTTLDERFDSEMIKPVEDRRLVEIAEGYRQLTERGDERVVRLYAERRLAQVELAIATADAIRDIRSLTNGVARDRRNALEERSQMRPPPQLVTRGFDAKGELRTSMIFASPVGPRRYRLVDPALVVPRTLCYVEVPRDLDLNMDEYVGRMVGIRASKKFLETGNVDPINVIVAEELVVLDRPAPNAAAQADDGTMEMMAVVAVDTLD